MLNVLWDLHNFGYKVRNAVSSILQSNEQILEGSIEGFIWWIFASSTFDYTCAVTPVRT